MKPNEIHAQNYTEIKSVPNLEIGTIGTGTGGLKVTGSVRNSVSGGEFTTNRSTPQSLPKSSGVPRHGVTIQAAASVKGRQTKVGGDYL